MRGEIRDLGLEVADDVRVDQGDLGGGRFKPARDVLELGFHVADGVLAVVLGRLQPAGEVRKARVDRLHDVWTRGGGRGMAIVDARGDLLQAALQFAEHALAMLHHVVMAPVEALRKGGEAVFQLAQDLVGVGGGTGRVDTAGDLGETLFQFPEQRFSLFARCGVTAFERVGEPVEALHQFAQHPGGVGRRRCGVDAAGDFVEAKLELAEHRRALFAGIDLPCVERPGKRREARFEFLEDLVGVDRRRSLVDAMRHLVDAPLQISEQRLALQRCGLLAPVHRVGEHGETLLDAAKDRIDVRDRRTVVDLLRDHGDVLGEPLHRLVRRLRAGHDLVDALRQHAKALDDLGGGAVGDEFLHLVSQRTDSGLDALE